MKRNTEKKDYEKNIHMYNDAIVLNDGFRIGCV